MRLINILSQRQLVYWRDADFTRIAFFGVFSFSGKCIQTCGYFTLNDGWCEWTMNCTLFSSVFCFVFFSFFFTVRVFRSVKQIGAVEIIKLIMLHWRRQRIGTTHHLDSRPLYRGWTFQNSRFNNNNKVLLVLLSVLRKWFGALPK